MSDCDPPSTVVDLTVIPHPQWPRPLAFHPAALAEVPRVSTRQLPPSSGLHPPRWHCQRLSGPLTAVLGSWRFCAGGSCSRCCLPGDHLAQHWPPFCRGIRTLSLTDFAVLECCEQYQVVARSLNSSRSCRWPWQRPP